MSDTMMTFLSEHFVGIILIIFIGIFVFRFRSLLEKAKKIDREGLVREAIVTRVEEDSGTEDSGTAYYSYVQYRDESDQLRESCVSVTPDVPYHKGDKILIKFLPGEYDMVRAVDSRED